MCLFGINYELEKGTLASQCLWFKWFWFGFWFRWLATTPSILAIVVWSTCLFSCSCSCSCFDPVSWLVACAGNSNGIQSAAGQEQKLDKSGWSAGGKGLVGMAMEPGHSSSPKMKLLPRSGRQCSNLYGKLFLHFSLLHSLL